MKHHPIINDRLSLVSCNTRLNSLDISRKSAPLLREWQEQSRNGRNNVSFVAVKSRKGDFSPSEEVLQPHDDYGRTMQVCRTPIHLSDESLLVSESLRQRLTEVSPISTVAKLDAS
jgi:hypothetical protein